MAEDLRSLQPDELRDLGDRLLRMVGRIVPDPQEAEDAVQDVWVKALTKNNLDSVRAWTHKAARWHGVTMRRVAARRGEKLGRRVSLDRANITFDGLTRRDEEDLLAAVRAAVQQLPDISLRVIITCRMEGRSFEDIGSTLGLHEAAVRRRFHEALKQLRLLLDDYF